MVMKINTSVVLFAACLFLAACGSIQQTNVVVKTQKSSLSSSEKEVFVEGNGEMADFYLGKYEVTQQEFEKVMGYNPSHYAGTSLPVENVNWMQALEYCNRLSEQSGYSPYYDLNTDPVSVNEASDGFRLPTPAEWKFAASGGIKSAGFDFSGSNTSSEVAWFRGNGGGKTHAVGGKKANELGLYHMSGNVYEWTFGTGKHKPILGGCFGDVEEYLMPSNSNFSLPEEKSQYTGFRVARNAKP